MKKLLYNSKDVEEKKQIKTKKSASRMYIKDLYLLIFFGFFEFFCKNILKLLQFCNNIKV